jgi:hypothetical protein
MKQRNIVMLTHPTLDQMQALGLAGMAAAYRQLAEQDNAADLSRGGSACCSIAKPPCAPTGA